MYVHTTDRRYLKQLLLPSAERGILWTIGTQYKWYPVNFFVVGGRC